MNRNKGSNKLLIKTIINYFQIDMDLCGAMYRYMLNGIILRDENKNTY